MRKCARAIIFDEQNRLLVFERTRQNSLSQKIHHYYSIPGGGMDPGETPDQAVVRELYEEMLVTIEPGRLLIHQIDEPAKRENFYFLARIVTGIPTFNPDSEEAKYIHFFQTNSFEVKWAELDDRLFDHYDSYGQVVTQLKQWVDGGGFPPKTVDMRVKNL